MALSQYNMKMRNTLVIKLFKTDLCKNKSLRSDKQIKTGLIWQYVQHITQTEF